jgi:hypothetical protein
LDTRGYDINQKQLFQLNSVFLFKFFYVKKNGIVGRNFKVEEKHLKNFVFEGKCTL